jgi:hypothetical protein
MFVSGITNMQIFSSFLLTVKEEIGKEKYARFSKVVLLIDGSSVNTGEYVQRFVSMNPNWLTLVIPAYSCQLNPIGTIFNPNKNF